MWGHLASPPGHPSCSQRRGLCFPGTVPRDQPAGPHCYHTEPDFARLPHNGHIQGSACWGRGPGGGVGRGDLERSSGKKTK